MVRRNIENTDSSDNRARLKEITGVLRKYEITQGLTPEKLRLILEELGPTYIKLGQILSMHGDLIPQKYCDELIHLHSEVEPMPFSEVEEVLDESYGFSWKKIFEKIDEKPIGSASIAQVHRAVLKTGEHVVIKVQRKGIYEIMSRDITLLHRAVRLIPPISLKEMVDPDMVLDELWVVAQEEMNFLMEAANIEEFTKRNQDVVFVGAPILYRQCTTSRVLVMEDIQGIRVDDRKKLLENGYDLDEIGSKIVDNFIRQVMVDGFFHADPHMGNLAIREGKIIWLDMGMMGRLTEHEKEAIRKAIEGIAVDDTNLVKEAVLALGDFKGKPNDTKLHDDLEKLLDKYGKMNMGEIDVAILLQEVMEVMKKNKISMPHGLTMLARGLTVMEGLLAEVSPGINMVEIAGARMKDDLFQNFDLKHEWKKNVKLLYRTTRDALELPSQLSELLKKYSNEKAGVNLDIHVADDVSQLLHRLIRNIVMGLWVMALLISSSIICTTNMKPKMFGIPALGALGYLFACIIVLYVMIKHFVSKK